jgi:hypothetical protein
MKHLGCRLGQPLRGQAVDLGFFFAPVIEVQHPTVGRQANDAMMLFRAQRGTEERLWNVSYEIKKPHIIWATF